MNSKQTIISQQTLLPIKVKHPDQIKRETIPSRADIPTAFHPCHDLFMVVPVPDITKVGTIFLPDRASITLNEGHIVEKGPLCSERFDVGDCVTWDTNSEYRMEVDGVKFILVRESVINMRIPRKELNPPEDPAQLTLEKNWASSHLTEGEQQFKEYAEHAKKKDKSLREALGPSFSCQACGEESMVSKEDIIHAQYCPENHLV